MRWDIWARKAAVGALVAAGLGACGALVVSLQGLQGNVDAPVWVAGLIPMALHGIGLLQNWLKHRKG
jgi:hypothetical protein